MCIERKVVGQISSKGLSNAETRILVTKNGGLDLVTAYVSEAGDVTCVESQVHVPGVESPDGKVHVSSTRLLRKQAEQLIDEAISRPVLYEE